MATNLVTSQALQRALEGVNHFCAGVDGMGKIRPAAARIRVLPFDGVWPQPIAQSSILQNSIASGFAIFYDQFSNRFFAITDSLTTKPKIYENWAERELYQPSDPDCNPYAGNIYLDHNQDIWFYSPEEQMLRRCTDFGERLAALEEKVGTLSIPPSDGQLYGVKDGQFVDIMGADQVLLAVNKTAAQQASAASMLSALMAGEIPAYMTAGEQLPEEEGDSVKESGCDPASDNSDNSNYSDNSDIQDE